MDLHPCMRRAARRWAESVGAAGASEITIALGGALVGGTQAIQVQRFTVQVDTPAGRQRAELVLKQTWYAELCALKAIAALSPTPSALPRLIDGDEAETDPSGLPPHHPIHAAWLVTPFYPGKANAGSPVPRAVFESLAALHAHYLGRTEPLTGIIEITPEWFRSLCLDYLLPDIRNRTSPGSAPVLAELEAWLGALALDARVGDALCRLPRTLLHGDMHSGNVLVAGEHGTIIDWANARLGPPLVDLVNVVEIDSPELEAYDAAFVREGGPAADPLRRELEFWYAKVQINTQYLGAALHFGGPEAALAMRDRARVALGRMAQALARCEA